MTQVFIALLFLGAIGYGVYHKVAKKAERKPKSNVASKPNAKEQEVIDIVREVTNRKSNPPVVVVRSASQKIDEYAGWTWKEFEDNERSGRNTSGFYNLRKIFMRMYDRKTGKYLGLELFAKLYIHESLHAEGHHAHDEEFYNQVREEQGAVLDVLRELEII